MYNMSMLRHRFSNERLGGGGGGGGGLNHLPVFSSVKDTQANHDSFIQ